MLKNSAKIIRLQPSNRNLSQEKKMTHRSNTFSLVAACAVVCLFALTGLSAKGESPDEKRANIQQMTKQTLADLYKEKPGVKARLEKATGYAVFSNLNVKIFMLGSGQ